MITNTQATLECEVCGAGWGVTGDLLDFSSCRNWLQKLLGTQFFADEPQECPECGEADVWDVVKPEGVE